MERKYGWLIFFFILVVIPLFVVFLFVGGEGYPMIFKLVVLAFFYFYCFLLKFAVKDWLNERNWKAFRMKQKESKNENNIFFPGNR